MQGEVPKGCIVSGGEVTVKVTGSASGGGTGNAGVGGRNQHFALYCAEKIAGENITVLSAGTDGIDGNSSAAGAVVDGTTAARARTADMDLKEHISDFNAFPVSLKLGAAIQTGPTSPTRRT